MKRIELIVLLFIVTVAVGFRFSGLDHIPPGLYPDEAMNGTDAIEAWETKQFKVFYPDNNGREGLYVNLQAVSVGIFGNTSFALRVVSALAGLLTVLGTYLLTRRLFDDWRIAAFASFLMAIGFWHVNFSRIGFRAILSPLMAVWGFYYLYKGIETHRIWHWGLAGLFFGLGMHTYIAFRIMPLSLLLVLLAYWLAIRSTFSHTRYEHARRQLLGSIAAFIGIFLLVVLPLAVHFLANPADFSGRTSSVSVFAAENPVGDMLKNTGLTLGMFFIHGDGNWRHNIAGAPILYWPVAALFALGLLHTLWRFLHMWRTRGHPGVPHTMLLTWFAVGLLPGILSNEGIPHALRTITAAPPVYIMAGLGLHWIVVWLQKWYRLRDAHQVCLPMPSGYRFCVPEGTAIVGFTVCALLLALTAANGARYFRDWAQNPAVARAFDERYVGFAETINSLPPATLKYVVGGDSAIPVAAQTVQYLTDTGTAEKQEAKNVFYLTRRHYRALALPARARVFEL